MKYLLAILACLGIFLLYIAISALIGWEYGGGIIPMLAVLAIMGYTWHIIIKHFENR